MCGRLNIIDHPRMMALFRSMGISLDTKIDAPRYNIAPGATLPTIIYSGNTLQIAHMKWGLTPAWAKPGSNIKPLINARSEGIQEKPSFRHLYAKSRVVIPVSGFYEWQRRKETRRAFHLQPQKTELFLMAGVWQISREGEPQCCIATTAANDTMRPIHHRMPVLLGKNNLVNWLNTHAANGNQFLRPAPEHWLNATEVSSYVNNARNQDARCIEPKSP